MNLKNIKIIFDEKDVNLNNPTIVVLTDRNDLDNQLYTTFSTCSREILPQQCKQAESRSELKEYLRVNAGGIIFTTIQKFEEDNDILSNRENIIFIADEAHRSQYGIEKKLDRKTGEFKVGYAKKMRDSLPQATFIAFTGTPIEYADKNNKIRFYGFLSSRDELRELQEKATMLINMRDPKEEASKFCFPSKLFEYMLTGKPVLSLKLMGIPQEYFQYLVNVDSTGAKDIAKAIERVANENDKCRVKFGMKAREFIVEKKNNISQAERIYDFIQ